MRHLSFLLLLACSARPSGPASEGAAESAPRPDPLGDGIARGRIALHDGETLARLGEDFDPRALDGVEGFIVELDKRDGWSGVVGRAPLVGCCLEPVDTEPPERTGQGWRIHAREGWSFHACEGEPTELLLHLRPDGKYSAVCGSAKVLLTAGVPLGEHFEKWQRKRADAILAAVADPRLAGSRGRWTFDGHPVGRCAVLALGCDPQRLLASCELDATRVLRVQPGAVAVAPGDSRFAGAEQCVHGSLPGLRDDAPQSLP